jgi:hypothetical protein
MGEDTMQNPFFRRLITILNLSYTQLGNKVQVIRETCHVTKVKDWKYGFSNPKLCKLQYFFFTKTLFFFSNLSNQQRIPQNQNLITLLKVSVLIANISFNAFLTAV